MWIFLHRKFRSPNRWSFRLTKNLSLAAAVLVGTACFGQEEPLSAIDWLSQPTQTPFQQVSPIDLEEPVATSVEVQTVVVSSLDQIDENQPGLMPLDVAGLPPELWAEEDSAELQKLLAQIPTHLLPAARDLFLRVVLAKAASSSNMVNARVDALLRFGAVQPAFSMLDEIPPTDAAGFDRYFDAALLTWQVSSACRLLQDNPALSQKAATKIYCTARVGEWDTAVLQYFTHDVLGDIPRPINQLLGGFLEPGLAEELNLPPVNAKAISPLEFRLRESVGAAVPTTGLSLEFVATDLQPAAGWRAQVEAAEKLAAAGALPAENLLDIYTLGKAAASGGVWERVRLTTAFKNAVTNGDKAAMQSVLPALWKAADIPRLRTTYAEFFAEDLQFISFQDETAEGIRKRIIALSADVPAIVDNQLFAQAEGTQAAKAISLAFAENVSPRPVTALAIMQTLSIVESAQQGDVNALQLALLGLRSLGFEDEAKRLAAQFMILVAKV